MGLVAPPPGAHPLRRIGGITLIIVVMLALLALGWGIVKLVALPFGGINSSVAVFWGFLLVAIVLGALAFIGRRRQKRARARAMEQRGAPPR